MKVKFNGKCSPENAQGNPTGRCNTVEVSPELSTGMMLCVELTLEEVAHGDGLSASDCHTWRNLPPEHIRIKKNALSKEGCWSLCQSLTLH